MKLACLFAIAFLLATASALQTCQTQSDCPSGMYCVQVSFAATKFCRSAAKKGGLCSKAPMNGVYMNLPPCASGLKCEGTILTCH
ncbi:hypothetical protein CEXT_361261 [Caerostris extrusa]|uniref:Uncharacterized protein n=1 Tax=Caerostris extrusa TaxID=172846 RepID=A0AAV4Y854_CAEEX|nr:hypothetical protein CEXT_361261 [Caerostris extrusa]